MYPSTFNQIMNNTATDFDQYEYVSLDNILSQVEFQESLNCEDLELPDLEEL